MLEKKSLPDIAFLSTDEKTVNLISSIDWEKTSIGCIESWPQSLRSALSICFNSNFPIAIYWGKELVLMYNEAWSPIPGNKHPWAFGKPAIKVWPEIWSAIEPQFQKAFTGVAGGSKDALLPMQRHGYTEECYFDFTFTPIFGESGKVDGIFNAVIETTYRVINERRAGVLQKLVEAISGVATMSGVFSKATSVLSDAKADVPFFFIYEIKSNKPFLVSSPPSIQEPAHQWPIEEVVESGIALQIENLDFYLPKVPDGVWPEPPSEGIVLPIKTDDGHVIAVMVAGASSRRKIDKDYRGFFESIGNLLSSEIITLQSLTKERERAESLSQIDKAKTIFFSNISHEFRTPLTLMLSPLEEVLNGNENLSNVQRQNLEISLRNTLRLQKLVNTLLDFSKIEAGKLEAKFELIDLGKITRDLASSFRSAIESSGIAYEVTIGQIKTNPPVDVEMWEKIVLNLISNAFKYTDQGKIGVELFEDDNVIILRVSDSGIGIDSEHLGKIFERFYRIHSQGGRSQEGTGIGLAMVRELVLLHNGEIGVESERGKGSVFTVKIPIKSTNALGGIDSIELPQKTKAHKAFVEEASKWNTTTPIPAQSNGNLNSKKPVVIIADDNQDMREYISRILSDDFETVAVSNGADAFEKAKQLSPALILSDIMMPKLDGFGLLKALKSNSSTRSIPLIFLSARAGEEATIEGIEAGADDYLVKPFSSKELFARVSNQININNTRREIERQFFNLFLQSPVHIHVLRGPDHIFEFFHPLAKAFTGGRDFTGKKVREVLPEIEGQGYFELLDQVYHEGKSFNISESKAFLKNDKGELEDYYFHVTYLPWRDIDGTILGVLQFSFDVTEQAKARLILEEAEYKLHNAIELANLGTWHIDLPTDFVVYNKQIVDWWGLDENGASLQQVVDCIHEDDRAKVSEAVAHAISTSGLYQADYRVINAKTGEERYIVAKGKVFYDKEGKPVRLSGISRDITTQKIAQHELERLINTRTIELREANLELRRSNEDLRQFAYVASHDLQEPLRKIQTFSELVKSKSQDESAAKVYLDKIDSSAARMSALIKDVLAYSQASNKDAEQEAINLNDIVESVKTDYELMIQQKGVSIEAGKLPTVVGSRRQFSQLFSNLISNSIKFAKNNPIIRISARVVETVPESLSVKPSAKYRELSVEDNGIGFEPVYAQQIFELFSRLHNRQDYGGTGIGLALCKKIVENHGGAITATSKKGIGTTFTIYLPE